MPSGWDGRHRLGLHWCWGDMGEKRNGTVEAPCGGLARGEPGVDSPLLDSGEGEIRSRPKMRLTSQLSLGVIIESARAPERQSARAPERQSARAPERQSARAPERQSARAERQSARAPERQSARAPERQSARAPSRTVNGYATKAVRLTTILCLFVLLYTFVKPASAAIATVTSNIENGGTHTYGWTSSDTAVVQRFKTGRFPKYEIENIWIVHKKKGDGTCPIFQLWIWTTPDASTRKTIGLAVAGDTAVGGDTDVVDRGTEDCVRKYRVKKNNGPDYSPLLLPGNTDYYIALALKDPYDARRGIQVSLTTWTGSDPNRRWEQDNEIGTGNTGTGTITFRAKNSGALRFRIEETVNTPPQFVGESNKDLGFSTNADEKYSCGVAKGLALQTAPWEITVREHLAMGDYLCSVNVYDANKGDKLTLSVSEGYFWVFGDLVYGGLQGIANGLLI